jgi:hypothetical protein
MRFRLGLAGVLLATHAVAASPTKPALVPGATSPAEAEELFGMPTDIVVARNGAITLLYPYERIEPGLPGPHPVVTLAASIKRPAARMVAVHFGPDLTYQGYSALPATLGAAGFASR